MIGTDNNIHAGCYKNRGPKLELKGLLVDSTEFATVRIETHGIYN